MKSLPIVLLYRKNFSEHKKIKINCNVLCRREFCFSYNSLSLGAVSADQQHQVTLLLLPLVARCFVAVACAATGRFTMTTNKTPVYRVRCN